MALRTIRAQKLKSFFSLIGVLIGVTFLIAVVSIVQGMNRYMEDRFANGLIGLNTFEVRRFSNFDNGNVSEDTWREWLRRPRVNYQEAAFIRERVRTPTTYARTCYEDNMRVSQGALRGQIEVRAADEEYFRIKSYRIAEGRTFTPQEARGGLPVIVIGDLVREKFFPAIDPIDKNLIIAGLPYRVVGVMEKQGSAFGISFDKFIVAPHKSALNRFVNAHNVIDAIMIHTKGASE